MLKSAMVVGLIAGLVVGGVQNVVTVPVIEEAIAFEQAASDEVGEPLVSLGAQRVGLLVGQGIFGVVLGAIFAGFASVVKRYAAPGAERRTAMVAGIVGFWSISLFPALRYPPNPPGVGDAETLVWRQGFQLLFIVLSAVAVAGVIAAVSRLGRAGEPVLGSWTVPAVGVIYLGVAAFMFAAFPENPDPVNAPTELVREFRVLTVMGHALLWALIAVGTITWSERRQAGAMAEAR